MINAHNGQPKPSLRCKRKEVYGLEGILKRGSWNDSGKCPGRYTF